MLTDTKQLPRYGLFGPVQCAVADFLANTDGSEISLEAVAGEVKSKYGFSVLSGDGIRMRWYAIRRCLAAHCHQEWAYKAQCVRRLTAEEAITLRTRANTQMNGKARRELQMMRVHNLSGLEPDQRLEAVLAATQLNDVYESTSPTRKDVLRLQLAGNDSDSVIKALTTNGSRA